MLVNKNYIFLLPLFFILTLSSCEKRPVQEEQVDALIEPLVKLEGVEGVKDEISLENHNPASEPSKELIEIDSLNKTALKLSAENEELEKKLRGGLPSLTSKVCHPEL